MKVLDRRTLLRGAGGITIGLPFLEIMSRPRTAAAQAQPPIKRLIIFFSPDGSIRENWTPTGTETSFQLSRILAPLEATSKTSSSSTAWTTSAPASGSATITCAAWGRC